MSLLPGKHNAVALYPFGSRDGTQSQTALFQHRPLFDVQLEVSCCITLFVSCLGKLVNLYTASAQGILETNSLTVGAAPIGLDRIGAGKGR